MASTKIVQVVDGGSARYIYTFRTSPKEILKQYGVTLKSEDKYDFSSFRNNFATIEFFPAFPVKVSVDNTVKTVLLAKGTVSDVLANAGVTLGENDEVNLALDLPVSPGTNVIVGRVAYKTVTENTPISYQTVKTATPLLSKNSQHILVAGQNGVSQTVYKQKYLDGILTDQQVISQSVISQPVTCQMQVGTAANTPVSTMLPSSGLTLTGDGIPANYTKVIHGVATGYSPSDGSTAATGKAMRVGYAAVNPKVIPYGTKLYVMSPDGSFVYGYCEAVDTGGFATNGSGVDIDLYFNTAYETGLLGRKSVNIYILS